MLAAQFIIIWFSSSRAPINFNQLANACRQALGRVINYVHQMAAQLPIIFESQMCPTRKRAIRNRQTCNDCQPTRLGPSRFGRLFGRPMAAHRSCVTSANNRPSLLSGHKSVCIYPPRDLIRGELALVRSISSLVRQNLATLTQRLTPEAPPRVGGAKLQEKVDQSAPLKVVASNWHQSCQDSFQAENDSSKALDLTRQTRLAWLPTSSCLCMKSLAFARNVLDLNFLVWHRFMQNLRSTPYCVSQN